MSNLRRVTNPKRIPRRFGIAEIYGRDFSELPANDLRHLATVKHTSQPCPFRGTQCRKKRGVCSLRSYEKHPMVRPAAESPLVTVCPERFKEDGIVRRWVSETLLGTPDPVEVFEVDFLESAASTDEGEGDAVGRIDTILVRPGSDPMDWCAVELQAVYFSGKGMESQFTEFARWSGAGIPFPNEIRRPDYRSSGPKRLMPQLQVKVPTLRRWGKKMAVVTDRTFFESMGRMDEARDISNCDIVWFVVDYERAGAGFRLAPFARHCITLERAIEGLVAGEAVPLSEFESRVAAKLTRPQPTRGRGL